MESHLLNRGTSAELKKLSCYFSKRCRRWRSTITRGLSPIAKKEIHAGTPFRQGHRSVPDSHTGRLQLLFHQTTSIATLRFDGPAHAWMATYSVVGHVAQPALQALHCFIRHALHSQSRSQHLCPFEEIAFYLSTVYQATHVSSSRGLQFHCRICRTRLLRAGRLCVDSLACGPP